MSGYGTVQSFQATDKGATVVVTGASPEWVAAQFQAFFFREGYKLEKTEGMTSTYGKGNAIARLLLGGLVKRSKYDVTISGSPESVTATLGSAMKGYGGGALGVVKEKKLRAKLLGDLKAFLGSAAPPTPT